MTTEHYVSESPAAEEEAHEVLTVAVLPLSQSLVAAVEESHMKPKEVNLSAIGLTADKRLVGALDSACNRACTGPDWLHCYPKSLQNAPEEIQNLVQSKPGHETFHFGNGGTKVSLERWRLPTVIGGQVDVPSLGLFLGTDFLEAVGADISFLRRELRCERLDGQPIALKQLSAGHYLLPLVPTSWPTVGTHRWRRMGPDVVVEWQMDAKSWFGHCMKGSKAPKVSKHDHMLTEKSLEVGNLVRTVMTATPRQPVVQAPDMRPSAMRSHTMTPSTTSTTTREAQHGRKRPPAASKVD